MGFLFIRLEDDEKDVINNHAKKMGYGTVTRFVKIAIADLIGKDNKLTWRIDGKKSRRSAG